MQNTITSSAKFEKGLKTDGEAGNHPIVSNFIKEKAMALNSVSG
jgi:hypothetical protein